jgi:hypothetical protein
MNNMTSREALNLAAEEIKAGRSGVLLFGGRGTRKNPRRRPYRVRAVEHARGLVVWQAEDGSHVVDQTRTSSPVWVAAVPHETDAPTEETDAPTEETDIEVRTRFRVTWTRKGQDKPRTENCIVSDEYMTRPGDEQQRNDLIRRILANAYLPIGEMDPDNIVLLDVEPVCNCDDLNNCTYSAHGGQRFALYSSPEPHMEWITDHHDSTAMALVRNTLSVEVLTLIRRKYSHQ